MKICDHGGKTQYPSRGAARKASIKMKKRRGTAPKHIYKCPTCGDYHLSNLPPETKGLKNV